MAKFKVLFADTKAAKLRLAEAILSFNLRVLDSAQEDERDVRDWTIILGLPHGVDPEDVECHISPIYMRPYESVMKQMMEHE